MNNHAPYFVCGLPRSRTAWAANWLTTDSTLCFHEPQEPVEELLEQYPQFQVGVSSCMLVRDYFALARQYPTAKWVYIDRDKDECRKSMLAFARGRLQGEDYDALTKTYFTAAQIIKDDHRTMVVNFADMDKHLPVIWHHLFPELTFNAIRSHLLTELKVEQRLEPALNRITNGRQMLWQQ